MVAESTRLPVTSEQLTFLRMLAHAESDASPLEYDPIGIAAGCAIETIFDVWDDAFAAAETTDPHPFSTQNIMDDIDGIIVNLNAYRQAAAWVLGLPDIRS